jgi:hypothetical protein
MEERHSTSGHLSVCRAHPWEVGLRRVQSDDTPVSWRMAWIAEAGGQRVGAVIVHQLAETPEQLEATIMSPL